MYKVVIIDDEVNGREILSQLLTNHSNIQICATAESAQRGIDMIVEHEPDIVFLDIEMPNGSGFTVLDDHLVQTLSFHVIFTTAFEKYALKAIKYAALDYLLKPIDKSELNEALRRITEHKKNPDELKEKIDELKLSLNKTRRLKLISRDGFEMVDVDDIVYLNAETNYTLFHFENKPKILVSKTMKVYQLYLEEHGFIRIHRSHIINPKKLTRYLHGKGGQVVMCDKTVLDVGPDFRKKLLDILDKQ